MPIHFRDLDVLPQVSGAQSVLIVPCQMCPAVTVAVREGKPFIQLFKGFLKSIPFEQYLENLRSDFTRKGIHTDVFRSPFPHQWFLCMWPSGQCRKLKAQAEPYEAVVVLGCDSATETVRALIGTDRRKVVQGMAVTGIMNARMRFQFPLDICFDNCRVIPIPQEEKAAPRQMLSSVPDEVGSPVPIPKFSSG